MATFATKIRKKSLWTNWHVTFLNLLCGYTKTRQKKREKNTASKVPMDDTTAVLEPEEKITVLKKIFGEISQLGEFVFIKMKENIKDL